MNMAGTYMLQHIYPKFIDDVKPVDFGKMAFKAISKLDGFAEIWEEAQDILNPDTPARNSKRLQGKLRFAVIEDFIDNNEIFIYNDIFNQINLNA
jgi:hypothetical protein